MRGALDAGLRAIRLDVVRTGGPSEAEFVAHSYEELLDYLMKEAVPSGRVIGQLRHPIRCFATKSAVITAYCRKVEISLRHASPQWCSPASSRGGRAWDPARRPRLVRQILVAEDRLEHALLVAHDQRVLHREQHRRDRKEPEHAGDDREADPDEEVSDVERVPHPGEDAVRHEALNGARATPRHRAGRRDAREPDRFAERR